MTPALAEKIVEGVKRELPDTPHWVIVLVSQASVPPSTSHFLCNADMRLPENRASMVDWMRRTADAVEQGWGP